MHKNKKQIITLFFLTLVMNSVFAEKAEKKCDDSDWRCHGSFHLVGGYIFVHQFYTNNHLTQAIPTHSAIDYTPHSAFPNNFNGVRVGFGGDLRPGSPFSYQLYYNQVLPQTKVRNGLKITADGKLMIGLIEYIINAKDRLTYSLIGGVGVISSDLTTTFIVDHTKSTVNIVDIDPIIGSGIAYQINSKLQAKALFFWDIATYNKDLKSRVVPAIVFCYYP